MVDKFNERISPIHEHIKKIKLSTCKLYPQQETAAFDIIQYYLEGERYVFLEAYTQSGKTGVTNCLINFLNYYEDYKTKLGIEHIYYIIGDNQLIIKSQTMISYLEKCFNMNFFFGGENYNGNTIHFLKNSDMKNIINGKTPILSDTKNNLFIIDESHYATQKKTNIVNKFLKMMGVNFMKCDETMNATNSYILSVSATPWKELANDIYHRKPVVCLQVTDDYKGFKDFDENGQIELLEDKTILKDRGECHRFFSEEVYDYLVELKRKTNRKHYCIVRSVGNGNIEIDRDCTGNKYHIIYVVQKGNQPINYKEMYDKIESICINETEEKNKFLLIVIKGAFRMGNVIEPKSKDYCGVCFDYSDSKDNVETTEQSLLGRFSGYINERMKDAWKNTKFYISKKHYEMIKNRYEEEMNYKRMTPYTKKISKDVYGQGYETFKGYRPNIDLLKKNKPIFFEITSFFNENPKWYELLSKKPTQVNDYTYERNGKIEIKNGVLDDIVTEIINFFPEIPNKYITGYVDENGKKTFNGGNRRVPTFNDNLRLIDAIDNGKRNGQLNNPDNYGCIVKKATIIMDANCNGKFDKQILQIQETIIDKYGTVDDIVTNVKEIETYKTVEPSFDFNLPINNNIIEVLAS